MQNNATKGNILLLLSHILVPLSIRVITIALFLIGKRSVSLIVIENLSCRKQAYLVTSFVLFYLTSNNSQILLLSLIYPNKYLITIVTTGWLEKIERKNKYCAHGKKRLCNDDCMMVKILVRFFVWITFLSVFDDSKLWL